MTESLIPRAYSYEDQLTQPSGKDVPFFAPAKINSNPRNPKTSARGLALGGTPTPGIDPGGHPDPGDIRFSDNLQYIGSPTTRKGPHFLRGVDAKVLV